MRPASPTLRALPLRGGLLAVLMLGFVLSAAWIRSAGAQSPGDWPQFQGGPGHAGVASVGPEPPYSVSWTYHVVPNDRSEGVSAPIIVGDLAIAMGPEALFAVDLATGEERWSVPREGAPSTPAVADIDGGPAVLYLDGRDADSASLEAISLDTQEHLWTFELEAVSRSGVTVDDEHAYVGDGAGNVYSIGLGDGQVVWTTLLKGEAKGPLAVGGGKVVLAPLAHDVSDRVDASVIALDAETGEEAWRFQPRLPPGLSSLPATDGSAVAVGYGDGTAYGFDIETGEELWSVRLFAQTWPFVAPAIVDGSDGASSSVYVGDFDGGLSLLDAASEDRKWLFHFNEVVVRSSPTVVGASVLLGLDDGSLAAVRSTDGHLVWRSGSSPGLFGAIAVGADTIVVQKGGDEGGLVAFRADPAASSIDEVSPTVPRYGSILATFAAAFAIVGVAILVPLAIVGRRVGPPEFGSGDDDDETVDVDDGDEP